MKRKDFLRKGALASAMAAYAGATYGEGLIQAVERTPQSSKPADLKITDIKCGYIRGGHSLFVKIYTNQDIWGCGEGVDATPGTYHLVKMMGQRIKGKSPLNVHRLFEDIRRSGFFEGAQAGMFIAVLTAVETALWDLTGKAYGMPVYQLLGGKFRDKIRVYCDTAAYRTEGPKPEDFAKAASNAVKAGYTAVKFDIDEAKDPAKYDAYNWTASQGELDRMYNQIAAVRKAVGPYIDICVDAHGRYDMTTGKKIAAMMEPLKLLFLEEPIPAENAEAYKLISQSTETPICAGENHYLGHGFRRLTGTRRRGYHHARSSESGRTRRGAAHCQPGQPILRTLRAAHGSLVPGRDGVVPRVRVGTQLPHSGMAGVFRRRPDVQGNRQFRRADDRERLYHALRKTGYRRGNQRGRDAEVRHARRALF